MSHGGDEALTKNDIVEAVREALAVVYMTAMCIGWWFGDRAINRMLMQRGK